ncbi:MAG: peptide deformylase [Planctomycetia bacterium]|nr:peptide deformylase [Planctomycetia bacterium]
MSHNNTLKRRKSKTPLRRVPIVAPHPDPETMGVVVWPESVLTRRACDVENIDPWLLRVIERMKYLMEFHEGVGLAAPQVGLSLRLFVMAEKAKAAEAIAVINPVLELESETEEAEEGCLSLPGIRGPITRSRRITLTGYDPQGAPLSMPLEGLPARIAQHEGDHLDGVLIISRMPSTARIAVGKKLRALEEKAG